MLLTKSLLFKSKNPLFEFKIPSIFADNALNKYANIIAKSIRDSPLLLLVKFTNELAICFGSPRSMRFEIKHTSLTLSFKSALLGQYPALHGQQTAIIQS